jgi:TonB C terminal
VIDRAEASGVAVSVIAHAALFGLLSLGFVAAAKPLRIGSAPIEVTLTDKVGLEAEAPVISRDVPKTQISPDEGPIEPDPAPAEPAARTQPDRQSASAAALPDPNAKAKNQKPPSQATGAATAKPPRKSTGLLGRDFERGLTDQPTHGTSDTPPAEKAGPEVQNALSAELTRRLRPFWKPPTGADADKLRTVVRVELDRSGAIVSVGQCKQTGITASNQAQASLHCENAKRAIRLAAPYTTFPDKYYDTWKVIFPAFDWRLSR